VSLYLTTSVLSYSPYHLLLLSFSITFTDSLSHSLIIFISISQSRISCSDFFRFLPLRNSDHFQVKECLFLNASNSLSLLLYCPREREREREEREGREINVIRFKCTSLCEIISNRLWENYNTFTNAQMLTEKRQMKTHTHTHTHTHIYIHILCVYVLGMHSYKWCERVRSQNVTISQIFYLDKISDVDTH